MKYKLPCPWPGMILKQLIIGLLLFSGSVNKIWSAWHWQESPDADVFQGYSIVDIIAEDGKFFAITVKGIYESADGIEWDEMYFNSSQSLQAIAIGKGIMVVGGIVDSLRSEDGSNWEILEEISILGVAYGLDKFVASINGGTISISEDGRNWEKTGYRFPRGPVSFGNDVFVATHSSSSTLAFSSDGIHFEQLHRPSGVFGSPVFGDGMMIAFFKKFGGGPSSIAIFSSGEWRFHPQQNALAELTRDAYFLEDIFICYNYFSGVPWVSVDGIIWEENSALGEFQWQHIASNGLVLTTGKSYAVPTLFGYCPEAGSGWIDSLWMGYLYNEFSSDDAGWMYSHSLNSWLFFFGNSINSVWVYDSTLGEFFWTSRKVFPWIFRMSSGWQWVVEG